MLVPEGRTSLHRRETGVFRLSGRLKWLSGLTRETNESILLLGAAPIPANFPPFAAGRAFEHCTVQRIAAIIRSNRRMARLLSDRLGTTQVVPFQHGLYFTLKPAGNPSVRDATDLAASLCRELTASGASRRARRLLRVRFRCHRMVCRFMVGLQRDSNCRRGPAASSHRSDRRRNRSRMDAI